ncbi:hypothetical protein RAD16_41020, partial [Bradyrhizobium sp. 18BD]
MGFAACFALSVVGALQAIDILFLVLDELAVKFIGKQVYGSVHIGLFGVGYDFAPGNMEDGFGFLSYLLDFQDDLHIGDLVKMPLQSAHFLSHVIAQSVGDFELMTANVQLHTASPD